MHRTCKVRIWAHIFNASYIRRESLTNLVSNHSRDFRGVERLGWRFSNVEIVFVVVKRHPCPGANFLEGGKFVCRLFDVGRLRQAALVDGRKLELMVWDHPRWKMSWNWLSPSHIFVHRKSGHRRVQAEVRLELKRGPSQVRWMDIWHKRRLVHHTGGELRRGCRQRLVVEGSGWGRSRPIDGRPWTDW